jgi:hypothetical protein
MFIDYLIFKSPLHDDAWRSETRFGDRYLMYAGLFPNTTKDSGGVFNSHKGKMTVGLFPRLIDYRLIITISKVDF